MDFTKEWGILFRFSGGTEPPIVHLAFVGQGGGARKLCDILSLKEPLDQILRLVVVSWNFVDWISVDDYFHTRRIMLNNARVTDMDEVCCSQFRWNTDDWITLGGVFCSSFSVVGQHIWQAIITKTTNFVPKLERTSVMFTQHRPSNFKFRNTSLFPRPPLLGSDVGA